VEDDSLEEIKVLRNDVLYANLALEPGEGQLSVIETMQGFLLGFYYLQRDGLYRIEHVCRCSRCPPQVVHPTRALSLGPVTGLYRAGAAFALISSFKKFREAHQWAK
jgi:hypothetical protein